MSFFSFAQRQKTMELQKDVTMIVGTDSITIAAGQTISYTQENKQYWKAEHNGVKGEIFYKFLSREYQDPEGKKLVSQDNKGNITFIADTQENKKMIQKDDYSNYIVSGGKKLKSGAAMMLAGVGIGVVGSLIGSRMEDGSSLVIGSAVVGTGLLIFGSGSIYSAGNDLSKYR